MSDFHLLETPTTRTRMLMGMKNIAVVQQVSEGTGALAEAVSLWYPVSERFENSEKRSDFFFNLGKFSQCYPLLHLPSRLTGCILRSASIGKKDPDTHFRSDAHYLAYLP